MSYKAGKVSSGNVLFIGLSILALLFFYSGNADAFSQYYVNRGCAGCHGATPTTCDGCHHHGSSGLQAQTDKGTYTPGEALGVTFDGGSQTGWIRAILYLNNAEVARSTGTGSPPRGGSGFPILFNTTAPATPGTYTYQAAWFGNSNDTGSTHGEVRVSTNSFTVTAGADTTPPTVTSRSPDNNAMGVAVSTAVTGTFNEAIAPATLTAASFLLRAGVDNVTGTVSLNPAGTIATFTPSASLANSTTYTATLTTAITDVAGNALAANHVWSFTTGAAGEVVPSSADDDDGWFGCAMSPAGGRNGGILGTYGPLILLALGIAFRRRVRRRKE